MNHRIVTFCFCLNYIIQAVVTLLTPVALLTLLAWFLTNRFGVGTWIYALLIFVGLALGVWSMISYLLKVSQAEKLREQQGKKDNEKG